MLENKLDIKLENKMNAFIEYCLKHSIDKYIISKYNEDIFTDPNIGVYVSNNYVYCSYVHDEKTYVFRFKDVEALLTFDNFSHDMEAESLFLGSIETIENDYKFNYEENEITTIINGHCLKSYIESTSYAECINTFDNDTGFILMRVTVENAVVHNCIQTVVGKLSKFNNLDAWAVFKYVPPEFEDLVNSQKVLLSMLAK